MRRFLLNLLAVVAVFGLIRPAGSAWSAPLPQNDETPAHFVVRGGRLFAKGGNEQGWIMRGWVEVKDGKIVGVGRGTPPRDVKLIDRPGAWIMPGLVSTNSRLFIGTDPEGIGPRYVAADKFNEFANFRRGWENGVTSARLGAPGDRFVSGIGSVVKYGGDPETARVLLRHADLLVNYNDSKGRTEPDIKEIPFPSSSDVPYDPQPERKPQGRMGRNDALFEALRAAAPAGDARERAMRAFLATGRPLRFDARRAEDIVQALGAARRLSRRKIPAYLNGADEALAVVRTVVGAGIPVVLEMDNDLSRLDDSDFDMVKPWRRDPRAAGALERAGVQVVIGGNGGDLLYAAAMAVGGGMPAKAALEAVTARPAALLGVDKQVGSLAAGKDADFIVLNGNPLASGNHVQEVWVSGKPAWKRPADTRPLIVRAGRIYDGTGQVYRNAEVLVEDGKIVAVGEGVPHPRNARIIDAGPRAVVTPGFVDSHGGLGFEGERANPGPEVAIGDLVQFARAGFEHVARAGVTTVVLAPSRVSSSGSQMAAIKTASSDHDLVTKPLAGVKLALSGSADQVRKKLTSTMSKGRKYWESWKKYEDALEGNTDGGAMASTSTSSSAPKTASKSGSKPGSRRSSESFSTSVTIVEAESADPLSGTWKVTLSGGPIPKPMDNITAKIRLKGKSVVGTMTNPMDIDEDVSFSGSFDGKKLVAEVDIVTPFGDTTMEATINKPESMTGSISLGGVMDITLSAVRTKKGAPKITVKAKPSSSGRTSGRTSAGAAGPKKPKFDARLEPFRAIFNGKAGLLLQVNGGPQIRAAAGVVGQYGIPVVILGAQDMVTVLDDINADVAVALGNAFEAVVDNKPVFVPAVYERRGIPIAFASSRQTGAALLPRQASRAVRHGLGWHTALKALTWDAARMLRLDDTVGALKKGLDGDLLIFDGVPFDPRTQLKTVIIRGQEVKK